MYLKSRKNYFITQLSLFLVYLGMNLLTPISSVLELYYGLVFLLLCFTRLLMLDFNKVLLITYVVSSVSVAFFDDTVWFLLELFTTYRETALEHWLAIGLTVVLFVNVLWLSLYSFFAKPSVNNMRNNKDGCKLEEAGAGRKPTKP